MRKALRKPGALYAAAFLLPVALFAVLLIVRRITPFGDCTLLIWDADGQYSAFLAAWRRVLLGGQDALYSLSRALGGNMAGLSAYYTLSPLNLLLALFPPERLPLGFTALVTVKLGLCGLFFMLYARRTYGADGRWLFFAASYGLTGYAAAYCWNVMWLDGVALLPLAALGLRNIKAGGKPFLYAFSLAAALFSCYYIGYMLCLFAVLYFAWFSAREKNLKGMWRFALSSLLAGGLTAVALLPAFLTLGGYGVETGGLFSVTRLASAMELATKLFTGAVDYDQMRYGLPNLYIGVPMLALCGAYFLSSAVPLRQKLCRLGFLTVFWLSFMVRPLYLVWHGLDFPGCMPARFSFLFCFFAIDTGLDGFCALGKNPGSLPRRRVVGLALGFTAFSCVLFRGELPSYLTYETLLLDVFAFAAACGLLWLLCRGKGRRAAAAALCLLQAGGLLLNGYFCLRRMECVDETTASAYAERYRRVSALTERVAESDEGVYRLEKNFLHGYNDPMTYGYNGLSHYSSDFNRPVMDFLWKIGLYQTYMRIGYQSGTTPVLNSLLGVKYLLWEDGASFAQAPWGYRALWTEGGVTAYENPYALPLGYVVPGEETADPQATEDSLANQNALLSDLLARPVEVFTPFTGAEIAIDGQWLDVSLVIPAGARLFLQTTATYFYPDEGGAEDDFRYSGCVELPYAEEDRAFRFRALCSEGVTPAVYLYAFDEAAFLSAYEKLLTGACAVSSDTDSHFVAEATAPEGGGQLLCTLPYDAGWTALVDGKPARTESRYGALLAVPLTQGSHRVELRFVPAGLKAGALLSLASLLALMTWIALSRRAGRLPPSWRPRQSAGRCNRCD